MQAEPPQAPGDQTAEFERVLEQQKARLDRLRAAHRAGAPVASETDFDLQAFLDAQRGEPAGSG